MLHRKQAKRKDNAKVHSFGNTTLWSSASRLSNVGKATTRVWQSRLSAAFSSS